MFHTDCQLMTKVGPVPAWLMGSPVANDSQLHAFIHRGGAPLIHETARRTLEDCESAAQMTHAAVLLAEGPFARYTSAGKTAAARVNTVPDSAELAELAREAERGSAVAHRMFTCRALWCEGEFALDQKDFGRAVHFFAQSIRVSHFDGDPFTGMIIREPGLYHAAIAAVPSTTNARLVRASVLLQTMNPKAVKLSLAPRQNLRRTITLYLIFAQSSEGT